MAILPDIGVAGNLILNIGKCPLKVNIVPHLDLEQIILFMDGH